MLARLIARLQYLLPRYFLTRLVHRLARVRNVRVKNLLITRFVRLYDVDLDDVALEVPNDFATFNDFFIRELKPGARPLDAAADVLVSPVDGTVSSAGAIHDNLIFQAKGFDYSLEDLLATDLDDARRYIDGSYATLYLAPYNYHRVHAPLTAELVAARYVPGELFSVNTTTASVIPDLFSRNERLVLHFDSDFGPYVLVFVGALNVGSISTPWSAEVRPRKRGVVDTIPLERAATAVASGDLLGWFNMGSTVIVLLPNGRCRWHDSLVAGAPVRMGRAIGTLKSQ